MVPILHWLPNYRWREDFVSDLMAGFTVAVMHVPQGWQLKKYLDLKFKLFVMGLV
jgi:MFS superfamily sulfate permease-like transporter